MHSGSFVLFVKEKGPKGSKGKKKQEIENGQETSSFRWSIEQKYAMALYLKDNFREYQAMIVFTKFL